MSEFVKLDKKMDVWKSRLLDFSKRNRLLKFKINKSTLQLDMAIAEKISS